MQRDAKRVDRFSKALSPELFSTLVEEWTAIGHDRPVQATCFADVAIACRKADVPPEAMLVAIRVMNRSFFEHGTPESERVDNAWHSAVRIMMDAYYRPPVFFRDADVVT
jgi:hypothetical protein